MMTFHLTFYASLKFTYAVEPLRKGQECLTKVAKFGLFLCIILYKSCLFYPSWQATSFERPPFWVAFIEGFHCILNGPAQIILELWLLFQIQATDEEQWRWFRRWFPSAQTAKAGPTTCCHSGETDEANCSWLHPVWPPPKQRDQDSTFCMVSRASTELIFCIHRDFDVRNNVCKPHRLVCEYCQDISAWKLRVMKPTVFRDAGRMKPTEYRDEANWFSNWTDEANCW